jgi:8-oxo-dGTP diphosphatase
MSEQRIREIACALIIDDRGRFLLQQRDDIRGILHPGKISLFGGHREGRETFLECVVREIYEELSYFVSPDRFESLISYAGPDVDATEGPLRGEFFVARGVPADAVVVTEGSLLIVEPSEVGHIQHKFTPATAFAIRAFCSKNPLPLFS